MNPPTVKPIKFKFNERKAVQAAGRLIAQSGGEMNYMALIKLLYLIDREALLRFGSPITGDSVVAMKRGPVLSRIFDLVSVGGQNQRPGEGLAKARAESSSTAFPTKHLPSAGNSDTMRP